MSLPVTLRKIGDFAFMNCTTLRTMLFPDHKTSVGNAVLTGCEGLRVLVLQNLPPLYRRRLEKWDVTRRAQVILYSDLKLAQIFSEMTDPNTDTERREELNGDLKLILNKMRKRNRLKTVRPLLRNLQRVIDVLEKEPDPIEALEESEEPMEQEELPVEEMPVAPEETVEQTEENLLEELEEHAEEAFEEATRE